jgi:hypothetical protein
VRTIAYHCAEALDSPPNNNKSIAPRFMPIYNNSLRKIYNNTSAGATFSLPCRVEIVQISAQDNIETLLRHFSQYTNKDKTYFNKPKRITMLF